MKKKLLYFFRKVNRWQARKKLRKNEILWVELVNYMKRTTSTGISWSDFWELYNTVRTKKPSSILECGPGASTMVMAFALMENDKEGYPGKITAIEELPSYLKMSKDLLPEYLRQYVEFILSPRVDDFYEIYRGVRYRDIPEISYDFVFIDGPHHHSPIDNAFCFDFDFIHVVKNADKPVYGLIDYRLSSTYVLQKLLGHKKVKFNYIKEIGIIEPCTKADLKSLDLRKNTDILHKHGRLFGNTQIELY